MKYNMTQIMHRRKPHTIIIINIIMIISILSLLFIVNDNLIIKLSYLWNTDWLLLIYTNTRKLSSILSISGNIGINIFTFFILIFTIQIIMINICIILYQNYNIILLILLSLWFTTTLTKNFWAKHTLNSTTDLISKLFHIINNNKLTFILLSLITTIFIVFFSRILSRSVVWFLLGVNTSLGILSFSLIILLSWPLFWYIVNILQKFAYTGKKSSSSCLYSPKQKLTTRDFEFCNPYVVEKVNLYGIGFNLIINFLFTINLYWPCLFICIILCISYYLIKYGDILFMYFISKSPQNSILIANTTIWESLLSIGAVLSTGLSEFNWDDLKDHLPPRTVHTVHEEKWINGTFNAFSGNVKMLTSRTFNDLKKYDRDLFNLRYQSRTLIEQVPGILYYSKYRHNTIFSTKNFQGFSLSTRLTNNSNILMMFIRSSRDNNVKYVPSFFLDPGLTNVDRDLREKYGIYTHEPEKYHYAILFTQEQKINDSFVKVWRPLPYSHMPFRGIQKENYYHLGKEIVRTDNSIICTISILQKIKNLIESNEYDNVKPELEKIIYYYMLLAKQARGTFDPDTSKGWNEYNLRDSYIHYSDSKLCSSLIEDNPNHILRLYKKSLVTMPLFDETGASNPIFVGNLDKLDFEAYEMTKEETGQELYSIIDTNNLLKWERTGDNNVTKTLVLYKDHYNILNDEDNTSIIRILANHFRAGRPFVAPSEVYSSNENP